MPQEVTIEMEYRYQVRMAREVIALTKTLEAASGAIGKMSRNPSYSGVPLEVYDTHTDEIVMRLVNRSKKRKN
jgi:hypothetical protein